MVATSQQRAAVIAAPPGVLDDECAAAVEDHQRVTLFGDVGGGTGEGAASWAGTSQRARSPRCGNGRHLAHPYGRQQGFPEGNSFPIRLT